MPKWQMDGSFRKIMSSDRLQKKTREHTLEISSPIFINGLMSFKTEPSAVTRPR